MSRGLRRLTAREQFCSASFTCDVVMRLRRSSSTSLITSSTFVTRWP